MPNPIEPIKEFRKEFDPKNVYTDVDIDYIYAFFKNALSHSRQQLLKEIREKVEGERLLDNTGEADDIAYNQALDDIKSLLNTIEHEYDQKN